MKLRLVLLGAGFALLAWAAWAGLTVVGAARDADAGRRSIERARDASAPADIVAGRPLPDIRAARDRFSRAHGRLRNPLLAPARILPIVGRQIRSADALTGAAEVVSDVAIDALTDAREMLQAPRGTGPERVALLRRASSIAERSERLIAAVDLGPEEGLIGRLSDARADLGDELASLRATLHNATIASRAAADLLAGPRRYLLFAANNAEMRAGSGMFLAVGELTTAQGKLSLDRMLPVGSVPIPRGVPVDGALRSLWGWANPSRDWQSLMMSPDFEASASLASKMWKAARGRTVDGVIAVDPVALQALVAATGPITVDGRRIDEENVVKELLHDQYERFSSAQAERRDTLGAITGKAMSAVNAGRFDTSALMSGIADAAQGRHLMIWSAKAAHHEAWRAVDVAGRLGRDSLAVSVLNRGGNKLDWFVRVDATLDLTPAPGGAEGVLRVKLDNRTPRGEPAYVAGPHPASGGVEGEYIGILAVNLPGYAGGARVDGFDTLGVVGADGATRVVGVPFRLRRGQTREFVVRFTLAGEEGRITVEPSARVSEIRWRSGEQTWKDRASRAVSWFGTGRSSR